MWNLVFFYIELETFQSIVPQRKSCCITRHCVSIVIMLLRSIVNYLKMREYLTTGIFFEMNLFSLHTVENSAGFPLIYADRRTFIVESGFALLYTKTTGLKMNSLENCKQKQARLEFFAISDTLEMLRKLCLYVFLSGALCGI